MVSHSPYDLDPTGNLQITEVRRGWVQATYKEHSLNVFTYESDTEKGWTFTIDAGSYNLAEPCPRRADAIKTAMRTIDATEQKETT